MVKDNKELALKLGVELAVARPAMTMTDLLGATNVFKNYLDGNIIFEQPKTDEEAPSLDVSMVKEAEEDVAEE